MFAVDINNGREEELQEFAKIIQHTRRVILLKAEQNTEYRCPHVFNRCHTGQYLTKRHLTSWL